jgi:hypothetical protein
VAIGVSKRIGMNPEAMSNATHNAIEPTALQVCRPVATGGGETTVSVGVIIFRLVFS